MSPNAERRGRLTGITQGSSPVGLSYDSANRRTTLTLPNGVTVAYTYDNDSRVSGITYTAGSTQLGNLGYTYDADGRRTATGGSLAAVNLPTNANGNTFNADNGMTTFNGAALTYDANGNLTSDGTNTYTWDARHHLTAIGGGAPASFVGACPPRRRRKALGRRMSKTINGAVTQFMYDGLNPVEELDGASPPNVTANLLTGLRIDEYFTRTDSSGTMAFMTDALGSTVGLVNSAGGIDTSYTYQPFGATTVNGTNANPYQFTGRENDGTGLYFYRARYYSPTYQRFIAQDPIGFGGGDANLYAYTRNAPTVWSDPLGWWIGQYPPPPPGSGGWGPPEQFPNGHWYLTDPSGTKWVAHPEDPGHWRHWDQQPPGGGRNRPWPPNSRKPRPNQNQCGPGQSATDPSGDAPEWQPPLSDPNSNMSVPVVPFDFPGLPPIGIPETLVPVPAF